MPAKQMEALEVIGSGADLLGVVLPAVGFAEGLIQWFAKAPAAPDPMMAALNKVHSALNEIEDLTLATWVISREENLSFLLAHSTAALHTANDFLQSGQDRSSPAFAAKIALAERDSLIAVQTVVADLDGGFWLRPESIKAISQAGNPNSASDGWMPHMPDRAEILSFNRVWDHRWGLPAAIYTIATRIAVLKATGTPAAAIRREVRRYNNFISRVFRRMEGGIRSLDGLNDEQINRIPVFGVPIAVADIYGGYYVGGEFDPFFRRELFRGAPFPEGLIVPTSGELDLTLRNAKILTKFWRAHVAQTIGLPDLLQFAGRLENLLVRPSETPTAFRSKPYYGGNGTPLPGSRLPLVGVLFGVTEDGELRWFRYEGDGTDDVSGGTGWHENSGNRIGNGWQGLPHLLGGGDGVIISVDVNGDMRWHRYLGNGEDDVSAATGWHENSGNQIGNGWQGFTRLFIAPATATSALVIFGVLENGDLLWHSYAGSGEEDPSGNLGWLENSGNPIGNGWQSLIHIHGSGNVILGVAENGNLLWFSYEGNGESDVSASTGWHPNSGNPIGNGWHGLAHLFGGFSDSKESGHLIYSVTADHDLLWHRYGGDGQSDVAASTGWHENSGNAIGNGW